MISRELTQVYSPCDCNSSGKSPSLTARRRQGRQSSQCAVPVSSFNHRLNDGEDVRKCHHQYDNHRRDHCRHTRFENHKWSVEILTCFKEWESQREEQVRKRHRHVRHQRQLVKERRCGTATKRNQQNEDSNQPALHPHGDRRHPHRIQARHRFRPQCFRRPPG